jgi:hypothetical protein
VSDYHIMLMRLLKRHSLNYLLVMRLLGSWHWALHIIMRNLSLRMVDPCVSKVSPTIHSENVN